MDIVVAADLNWGIGLNGTQPVVVPEDRKRFKDITGNGTVIVGRKTLMDFPGGRPLKNRRNIILTHDRAYHIPGGETVHNIKEALEAVKEDQKVFVIGGSSVYNLLLPYCEKAWVTRIFASPAADTFFHNLDGDPAWKQMSRGEELISSSGIRYRFDLYVNSDVRYCDE